MGAGALRAVPVAAILGVLSAKNVLAYAGIVSTLASVLVIGAVWAAAKAWRERAEARTDEAKQLGYELAEQGKKLAAVEAELRARPDITDAFAQVMRAIERNTAAVETLIRSIDPTTKRRPT